MNGFTKIPGGWVTAGDRSFNDVPSYDKHTPSGIGPTPASFAWTLARYFYHLRDTLLRQQAPCWPPSSPPRLPRRSATRRDLGRLDPLPGALC